MRLIRAFLPALFLACLASVCFAAGPLVVLGDSQYDHEAHRAVVSAIVRLNPAVVFQLGDLTGDGRNPENWKAFNEINSPITARSEYFPLLGNHEENSPLYFENFKFLEGRHWYSLDRQGVHFILLDSVSELSPGSQQYQWLEADLMGAKGALFKIVMMHYPVFNAGAVREKEAEFQETLVPLFERYGVSAVFSGHTHNYQRFLHNGIHYIISGGGGSPVYPLERSHPDLKESFLGHHFCALWPQGNFIEVTVFDAKSSVIDEFRIARPGSAPEAAPTEIKAEVDKARIAANEHLTYKLVITSSEKKLPTPALPDFKGFTIVSQAESSTVSYVKGSVRLMFVYVFILAPSAQGPLTIAPATITVGGRTYSSASFTIEVGAPKAPGDAGPESCPLEFPEEKEPDFSGPRITL